MNKKLVALLVVATMAITSLVGCGGSSSSTPKKGEENNTAQGGEKPYTVSMAYIGDAYPDNSKVVEQINEIMRKDINMELRLVPLSWGTYTDELTLMLSGSDKLDLIPIIVNNAAGYVSSGKVVDLADLIDKYGNNIKKSIDEDFIASPNIDGFTYGVTTKREWITQEAVAMRKDLLEEAGFKAKDINNLDDLEKVYEKVHEKHPDMTMLAGSQGSTPLFRWETFDSLEDGFGVLMDKGRSTEVVNLYETDEFREFAQVLYDWGKKDYISKDCATTTETAQMQVKAGTAFSFLTPYKADAYIEHQLATGYEMVLSSLFGDPYITGYSVNFNTWGIAHNSLDKEKAFQCLDYIYGSAEVMNLLNWGIEDDHYVFTDKEKGIITYPEGVDASTKQYGLNIGWELPNQFISHIWEGTDPGVWDMYEADIAKASRSKALGFAYDSSKVSNELTALNNVKNEYYDAIGSGMIDPAIGIDKFNEALYTAGLQAVLDLKQSELDQWLETQE